VIPMNALMGQSDVVRSTPGERLDSLFRDAERRGFHGNALVAQHGEVVLLKGYGFAYEKPKMRFSPSTLVQIGSNVKDFTKVAIYQLIEQNRLRLADSLSRFIDGLPADTRGITVQHLLEHTAGLPLGMGGDMYPPTRSEMLQRLKTLHLATKPRMQKQYSNLGYSLLAFALARSQKSVVRAQARGTISWRTKIEFPRLRNILSISWQKPDLNWPLTTEN